MYVWHIYMYMYESMNLVCVVYVCMHLRRVLDIPLWSRPAMSIAAILGQRVSESVDKEIGQEVPLLPMAMAYHARMPYLPKTKRSVPEPAM